jgi:hypothetical protein
MRTAHCFILVHIRIDEEVVLDGARTHVDVDHITDESLRLAHVLYGLRRDPLHSPHLCNVASYSAHARQTHEVYQAHDRALQT